MRARSIALLVAAALLPLAVRPPAASQASLSWMQVVTKSEDLTTPTFIKFDACPRRAGSARLSYGEAALIA